MAYRIKFYRWKGSTLLCEEKVVSSFGNVNKAIEDMAKKGFKALKIVNEGGKTSIKSLAVNA